MGKVLEQMFKLGNDYNIKFPIDYVRLAKTIITLEGLGMKYNPDFNLIDSVKPVFSKIMLKRFDFKNIFHVLKKDAVRYQDVIASLPKTISEIVDKIDVETERKELEYSAILCRAWGRMAAAAMLLIIPVLIFTIAVRNQLIRGMSFGQLK